jgi:membrane fusion protein (multidrug efflux system)
MATPDGDGPKPPPQPRGAAPAKGPDRPEAFGRGEHPQPRKPSDERKPGEGEGTKQDDKKGEDEKGEGKEQDVRPVWKRPVLMMVLLSVLLAAIIGGVYLGWWSYHNESTDDAFIDGRIVRVAPRVAGKVLRLDVDDNVPIAADTVIIEIDPQPFQVKLDQAKAAERQAEAQQAQAEANELVAEAQAAQADADVIVAQANARNAQQNFERFNKVSPQARSVQQLDAATADQRSTAATVTSQEKKADSMHAMVKAAATTVNAAIANVNAARSQVEQAVLDLSYTKVVAGHAGRVTRRRVEVGNYVDVGQEVVDVVPTEVPDIWVTANFKESQLSHMERGQRVTISVDAYPDQKLHGHVDSIQNGTGAVFSLLPPENATGNYVKVVQRIPVKIILDDKPMHMLSPGLSVEPTVDISSRPNPPASADEAERPAGPTHVEPVTSAP